VVEKGSFFQNSQCWWHQSVSK